jgi:hypothetical protein
MWSPTIPPVSTAVGDELVVTIESLCPTFSNPPDGNSIRVFYGVPNPRRLLGDIVGCDGTSSEASLLLKRETIILLLFSPILQR